MATGSAARIIRQIIHSTVVQSEGEGGRRRGGGGREEKEGDYSRVQPPSSHEEKGLVTTECFLGCAKSAVLVLNKSMKYSYTI